MKIRYFLLCLIIVLGGTIYLEKSATNSWIQKKNTSDNLIDREILSVRKNKLPNRNYEISNNSDELRLVSKAACVYDCNSKRLLYSKNANERLPMASTTKIMTCIIALEYGDLEDEFIVSNYGASMPDVQLDAIKGDSFKLKDLLYSLMLESHNDVAVVIAENIGALELGCNVKIEDWDNSKKCVKVFSDLMNDKVKELGLSNTNFVTPNGLDADKHYTTAYELACITAYALENKEFREIIGTYNYQLISKQGRRYSVNNKNQFLHQYKGAIGCKTGYTSKAGYCFVGAIDREEHDLVSVVLGCGWPPNKSLKWQDTKKLMDYGVEKYQLKEINIDNSILNKKNIKKYNNLSNDDTNDSNVNNLITVDNGNKKVYIKPYISKKYNILLSEKEKVRIKVKIIDTLVAPIKKGQIIGYAKVIIDKYEYKIEPIRADRGVRLITLKEKFTELLHFFLIS